GKALDKEAIETHSVDPKVCKDNVEPITKALGRERIEFLINKLGIKFLKGLMCTSDILGIYTLRLLDAACKKVLNLLKKGLLKVEATLKSAWTEKDQIDNLLKERRSIRVILRFNTTAGNPVKKILLKLNLSDHRNHKSTRWQSFKMAKRLCLVDDLKMLKITMSNTSSRNKLNPKINDHYNILTGECQKDELKTKDKALSLDYMFLQVASIDSKEYTITEASVRSKLQLADAIGIHNLSDAKIYVGLATLRGYAGDIVPLLPAMLAGAAVDQGEGSAQPAEPHHTPVDPIPSTSQPPHPSPQHQSPPHSPLHHSPYQSPPHSPLHHSPPQSSPHFSPPRSYEAPLPEGNTSGSAEDSMQLKELMVLVPTLVTRVTSLEKELQETKQTLGNVVLKLVKKVKSLETALKRKSKK
ncbi:hypothetical protein Tco_1485459, partial [Tanacetum coccineum]